MDDFGIIIFSVIITLLGAINFSGNISSIHWYNRRRITEENKEEYGKVIGTGTMIIGISMLVSSGLSLLFRNELFKLVIIPGCVVGVILILYGQFKYNKGLF